MAASAGVTEAVFPAAGKGMPDVISYLDEVPWSTAADVKPMKKSVMSESFTWPGYSPSGLYNPTTPYIFFSETVLEGTLDTGINATDLTVEAEDFMIAGARPIVYINGPVDFSLALGNNQITQQLSPALGPF
jgi:hypothetical protein